MDEPLPPRADPAARLEEHLRRLPAGASCRGLFFQGTIRHVQRIAPDVDLARAAGLQERRYVSFSNYPYGDFLRLNAAGARIVKPGRTAEGLRELGVHAYDTLLESQIGKVVLGAFGKSFEYVVMAGARGYAVSLSFGKVEAERVAPQHVRYRFHEMPAFLDTFQRGVVEGAMRACGVTGEVRVTSDDVASAVFDITWQ
jgi:uncharacterized protein (TIGR02265 family)